MIYVIMVTKGSYELAWTQGVCASADQVTAQRELALLVARHEVLMVHHEFLQRFYSLCAAGSRTFEGADKQTFDYAVSMDISPEDMMTLGLSYDGETHVYDPNSFETSVRYRIEMLEVI